MDISSTASRSNSARLLSLLPMEVYHWMQRRIRGRMGSVHILFITTIGIDTGVPQTDALGYFEDGANLVVVASNYGSDRHSTWYRNLRAHPRVQVQIEEDRGEMVASTATPAERERLWIRLATEDRQNGHYQHMTAREIPIVLLRPTELVLTG
jgi:deazaflavin-dependent oxidoreductase (nitroreductase family)